MNGVILTAYLPSLQFPLLYFILLLGSLEEQQELAVRLAAIVTNPKLGQTESGMT